MDLIGLAEAGLLEQRKEGRAFIFIAPQDLERRLTSLKKGISPA